MAGKSLSYKKIKNFIEVGSNSECKLLSKEYLGSGEKLKLQCKCGKTFETTWEAFNNKNKPKRQCNDCGMAIKKDKLKLKYNDVLYYIEVESDSGCKLKSKRYINNNSSLEIICKCGNIFTTSFSEFKNNKQQCNDCTNKKYRDERAFTYEYVKDFIENQSDSHCILLSKNYINAHQLLNIKCQCGSEFSVSFRNFKDKNKRQCNKCSASKGEKAIYGYLNKYNVIYLTQHKFNDCRNIYPLPYDFAILDQEKNLRMLIEYQGIQHFEDIPYFTDDKYNFEYRQNNDRIKREYCQINNIDLLEIPYWEINNINNILHDKLEKLIEGGEIIDKAVS